MNYPVLHKNNDGQNVHIIPIDHIEAEGEKPSDELVEKVKQEGVHDPIILKKDGDQLKVQEGNDQFLAAREAGLKSIKAVIC